MLVNDDTKERPLGVTGEEAKPSPRRQWAPLLTVVLTLFLLLLVQFYYFIAATDDPVFWRDEAAIVSISTDTWSSMLRLFADEWKCYAHQIVLRGWLDVFGVSEVSARALSAVAAAGAMILMFLGSKRWLGHRDGALLSATLLATGPLFLRQIQGSVQPYAFALLTAVWAFERFTRLVERRRRGNWIWMGVALFLQMNTQPVNYAAALALALVWMRIEICKSGSRPQRCKNALKLPMLALIASIPTTLQTIRFLGVETGMGRVHAGVIGPAYLLKQVMVFFESVCPFLYSVSYFALDDYVSGGIRALLFQVPWVLRLVIVGAGAVLLFVTVRKAKLPAKGRALDTAMLGFVPLFFLGLAGLASDRMVIPAKSFSAYAPGICLVVGYLLMSYRPLVWTVAGIVFLRAAVGIPAYTHSATGKFSNGKEAAQHILSEQMDDDLIVLANTTLSPTFSYYYQGHLQQIHHPYDHPIRYYHMARMYTHQGEKWRLDENLETIEEAAKARRRVWFIEGGTPPPLPQHRWFSGEDLPAFRKVLGKYFVQEGAWSFADTSEPYEVTLHVPKTGIQQEEAHAGELPASGSDDPRTQGADGVER